MTDPKEKYEKKQGQNVPQHENQSEVIFVLIQTVT